MFNYGTNERDNALDVILKVKTFLALQKPQATDYLVDSCSRVTCQCYVFHSKLEFHFSEEFFMRRPLKQHYSPRTRGPEWVCLLPASEWTFQSGHFTQLAGVLSLVDIQHPENLQSLHSPQLCSQLALLHVSVHKEIYFILIIFK